MALGLNPMKCMDLCTEPAMGRSAENEDGWPLGGGGGHREAAEW